MIEPNRVLEAARTALRTEPRVDAEHHPMLLEFADGTLTIQGEVGEIAAKKLALQRVAAIEGVAWVVDHLHLEPAVKMGDHEIRDHVRNALLSEPALAEAALLVETDGKRELVRSPPAGRGEICVSVEGGVVALEGELPSRAHKRLAALLAWWVPGTRDVVDGMAVVPYERDNDDEITDSVRTALEKDPLVDASQIRVHTHKAKVTLLGLVGAESERQSAERDAWWTLGVADVDNRILFRP